MTGTGEKLRDLVDKMDNVKISNKVADIEKEEKEAYKRAEVPPGEEWRSILLREMLEERQERLEAGEEGEDLQLVQSYIEILSEI